MKEPYPYLSNKPNICDYREKNGGSEQGESNKAQSKVARGDAERCRKSLLPK
jgi:hypothetical protein